MSKRKGDPGYAAGWCIHYRSSMDNETCEAGIRYDSFSKEDRIMTRCPCFIKPDDTADQRATCPQRRVPTPEEVALHEKWFEGRLNQICVVQLGIADWRAKYRGKSHAEVVECPQCKGRLHLSIAGSRGHVHARCETEGCVSWME